MTSKFLPTRIVALVARGAGAEMKEDGRAGVGRLFAELGVEVAVIALVEELFVIHEEHELGDGDDFPQGAIGLRAKEDLETFATPNGGRMPGNSLGEQAVEDTGADTELR